MKKKRIVKSLLFIMVAGSIFSTSNSLTINADDNNSTNIIASQLNRNNFIDLISPLAQKVANNNDLYPSLMVAQALLESYYGQSNLTQKANNLFGIKSFDNQGYLIPTIEFDKEQNKYITINDYFKIYPSILDSLLGYANFLNTPRYVNVHRSVASNVLDAAHNLQQDGYATDPNYTTSLINIINSNNLGRLDAPMSNSNNGSGSTTTSTSEQNGNANASSNTSESNNSSNTNNVASNSTAKKTNTMHHYKFKPNIKYSYVNDNNTKLILVSSKFKHYRLYTKIEDAISKNAAVRWPDDLKVGQSVYINKKARIKSNGHTSYWYRISFSGNRYKKWVYGKALTFPKIKYVKLVKNLKAKKDGNLYNHILGGKYLSQPQGNVLAGTKVKATKLAKYNLNGRIVKWYRIKLNNGVHGWINAQFLTNVKNSKKTIHYIKINRIAYVRNGAHYQVFKHLPGFVKQRVNAHVKLPKTHQVYVNLKRINIKHHYVWYRIHFHSHNYWVAAKSLIFRSK